PEHSFAADSGYLHTVLSEPNAGIGKCSISRQLAYSGVKLGKNGVEITAISRERMFEAVMKRLGLADSEFAQRLQQIEIERRQLEIDQLRQ
ncbi:terminase small subunit, partial [Klebsiella pneumoniae]